MAFVLDATCFEEMHATFQNAGVSEAVGGENDQESEIKALFKTHKNLVIRQLKRKWDICSLESYRDHSIIPRGLRERIIPASHLRNDRFTSKWETLCLSHGKDVLNLIIEEEQLQLSELNNQIEESVKKLDEVKDHPTFGTHNEHVKKEVEKVQRFVKTVKQKKFARDKKEFDDGIAFKVNEHRSRSRTRRRRVPQNEISSDLSGGETEASDDGQTRSILRRNQVNFLEEETVSQEGGGGGNVGRNNPVQAPPRQTRSTRRGRKQ